MKKYFLKLTALALIISGIIIATLSVSAELPLNDDINTAAEVANSDENILEGESLSGIIDVSSPDLNGEQNIYIDSEKLEEFVSGLIILMVFLIPLILIILIGVYVYTSLVYMKLAKKLGVKPAWLAWIPIVNLYLISKTAQKHWWPMLLILTLPIPIINILAMTTLSVFIFFWHLKIFSRIGCPEWWALTSLLPGVGVIVFYVFLGIAAWGRKSENSMPTLPLS